MRNLYLTLTALLLSFSSFAIGPITGITSFCVGSTTTLSDTSVGGTWSSSFTAIATVSSASGIVTGISIGTAIITYRVGVSYTTTTITVNPTPTAITGPSVVCVGAVITFSDAVGGGTWSSSAIGV